MEQITLHRPTDWPEEHAGIDLDIHDLPHASSGVEWWYINGHFSGSDGRDYSLFASFFRQMMGVNEQSGMPEYAHSITWAIIDVENEGYYHNSRVDKKAPEIGLERLRNGDIVKDKYLRKAAIEMLEKGVVPYPDRLFEGDVSISPDELNLQYDTNSFTKSDNGEYHLSCYDEEHQVSVAIRFKPEKPVVRHGNNGIVYGASSEDMFYYFIPRSTAKGTIEINNAAIEIEGTAWYDHEFGAVPPEKEENRNTKSDKETGWNWLSGQLSCGCEISAFQYKNKDSMEDLGRYLIVIDEEGNEHRTSEFSLEVVDTEWTSMRSFLDYPLKWSILAPQLGLHLTASASFPFQEFTTVISKPAFWEGRVEISGILFDEEVNGPGFVEVNVLQSLDTLEDLFKIVSRETIKSTKYIIPRYPKGENLDRLIASKETNRFSNGVDSEIYTECLIDPIRSIIDRGGKSWRSYAALACCDIVGGDPHNARQWLALPELMHVGSLIVDDVQDKSSVRRGGPAAHKLYGEPLAINAGTACYFISQICMYEDQGIGDSEKLRIYEYYFEALRAGHSGQSLDIYGLDYLMDEVVNDNSGRILEDRVMAIHKLKCAAPSGYLARIGALIGGGSEDQIEALGSYYEALGIAFQIIDDTLNIEGFRNDLKTKAEDISAGKITYPIAKAMHRLESHDRQRLWEILKMRTKDLEKLDEAISLLIKVNALKLCQQEAREIMDNGWQALDPYVRDSFVKMNLRAFSWFVLDRHY